MTKARPKKQPAKRASKPSVDERMISIGLDPGTANAAIAVSDVTDPKRPVVLSCGMFPAKCLLRNITGGTVPGKRKGETHIPPLENGLKAFLGHAHDIIDAQPKTAYITIERFMVRRLHTATIEMVGLMNGALIVSLMASGFNTPNLIPASEWKAFVNKSFDLKAFYKTVKRELNIEPHVVDAVAMSLWCGFKRHDVSLGFGEIKPSKTPVMPNMRPLLRNKRALAAPKKTPPIKADTGVK